MRPLHIGAFDVRDGRVVAVDRDVPLAVEADLATGQVLGAWTWEPAPGRRGRLVVSDVVLTAADAVVASPAAGGLVRIDRATGVVAVLALDIDVGRLVRAGDAVWAVGASAEQADPTWPRRPVMWQGLPVGTEPDDLDDDDDDDPDPSMRIEPSTPLWRADGATVTTYDLGGRVEGLAILGDEVVAIVTRPADPLVKRWLGPGSLAYERPATVMRGDPARGLAVVGSVPEGSVSLLVDRGAVWLAGSETEESAVVWRLGVRDDSPVPVRLAAGPMPEPIAVAEGRLVGLEWGRERRRAHVVPLDPGDGALTVGLPHVDDAARTDQGMVWFRCDFRPVVVGLDVERGTVAEVVIDLDCATYLPAPVPPPGLDLAAHEAGVRDDLHAVFFGGWTSAEDGSVCPYIQGVTFESVELEGAFPTTAVVALFRSEQHPGVRFGRRWALYDELGNPEDMEYEDIGLMEDVEAAGYGLPPLADCVPDAEGITWFGGDWQDG
jgi:hypothetical protein